FVYSLPPPPPDLHSFPTRRSSDLWPLSTTLPLRPRPSAQPELPGESRPASLPTPVRPVSPLESVLRRRHCALCRSFDFEFRLARSEEHTSELQSRGHLVCRLLLEK